MGVAVRGVGVKGRCAASRGAIARLVAPLLGFGVALSSITAANAAIFGRDDRIALPETRREVGKSIGLIYEAKSRTICTAFCVGEATVATAAHCIFRASDETVPKLAGFNFRLPDSVPLAQSELAGTGQGGYQYIASSSSKLSIYPPIDAAHDWALLRLHKPICKGRALPLSRRPAQELVKLSGQTSVYHVSYHRDFGSWELAYAGPCAIRRSFEGANWSTISRDFSSPEQVILHTCDTGGASSGSPLLIDGPQGPEVIGINVGTYVLSRVLKQNGQVVHRYKADTVANTGVSASAFINRLYALERAEILATRGSIRELQSLLGELGHYRGRPDGTFGPSLRTAIESFERAEGRPATGLATTTLLTRVRALSLEQSGPFARMRQPSIETGSIGSHEEAKGTGAAPASARDR